MWTVLRKNEKFLINRRASKANIVFSQILFQVYQEQEQTASCDYNLMNRMESSMPTLVEQAQRRQSLSDTEDVSFSDEVCIDKTLFSEEFSAGKTYRLHEKQPSEADIRAAMSDTIWRNLYPDLHSLACYLVRTSPLPYWRGQEDDMANDIAQETVRRVIERALKAMRGEAPPIQSLKQMANTVAYNYYRDLKRHDYRLSRLDTADANTSGTRFYPADVRSDEYLLDLVADKVDQDRLFDLLASEISHFPVKQKQAILIDLANRMYFDEESTSLQRSFLKVGIELRHYRQSLPEDQRERGRHISLCSQAYKRVTQLLCTPELRMAACGGVQ
jgi:DNA-directed RNA polymerase specialized sigma24 family protein